MSEQHLHDAHLITDEEWAQLSPESRHKLNTYVALAEKAKADREHVGVVGDSLTVDIDALQKEDSELLSKNREHEAFEKMAVKLMELSQIMLETTTATAESHKARADRLQTMINKVDMIVSGKNYIITTEYETIMAQDLAAIREILRGR